MNCPIVRIRRSASIFLRDETGVILPYVALLMTVLLAMGALAVDVGRQSSLQTQMQAIADAMAVAGARELTRGSDSIDRANAAINNIVNNGISQLGYSGSISHTTTFYSAINAATVGGGTTTSTQSEARFVQVNVTPVSISSIFGQVAGLKAGASALAGFKGTAACSIAPMFICNPYESGSMTDAQATAALHAALDPKDSNFSAATLRKQIRMIVGNKTSPGHFGWLQPANIKCNSTSCLKDWASRDTRTALAPSCYDQTGVTLATGNKPLADYLNDRFDIYAGLGPSASYSPSINVRKGYSFTGGNACNAAPDYYVGLAQKANAAAGNTGAPSLASATATPTANANNTKTFAVTGITGTIQPGMQIFDNKTDQGVYVSTYSNGTVTTNANITVNKNKQLTFVWLTAPLPLDSAFTGLCDAGICLQGNGDWDCLNYWKINHSDNNGSLIAAAPAGCTSASPSVSRFQVYQYENSLAGNSPTASPIKDQSGYYASKVESGSPLCAINKNGYTPIYDATFDQRIIYAAVINCNAQQAAIGGGNSGSPVPAAGFAKFFLTQPYGADNSQYLYGEMTGLVNSLDSNKLYNQVQLYR